MAASDKSTRRTEDVERLRHLAATEAAAFSTTAGTMLLGLLTGAAEAAQQQHTHEKLAPDTNDHTQPPPAPPVENSLDRQGFEGARDIAGSDLRG